MSRDATHASWFSGVGGLDLGLERAGWRTVSFSEIDPYASAVLAERWPGVPNYGDIVRLAAGSLGDGDARSSAEPLRDESARAVLWTGGFPCQDLSVAGKRAGFGDIGAYALNPNDDPDHGPDVAKQVATRSGLAFAFLDLVERHRPPAILLENVPGLLSSHRGRDMAALLGRMVELGYGVAYRVLDARHFGVPQRRRRVFIVGLRSGPDDPTGRAAAERAAQVLAVGTRCPRHPASGGEAGAPAADGTGERAELVGASSPRGDGGDNLLVSPSPDPGGVRAADGLAGRSHDRELAATLNSGGNDGGFRTEPGEHLVTVRRATRAHSADDADRWEVTDEAGSLNGWDLRHGEGNELAIGGIPSPAVLDGGPLQSDDLLPLGLDSHRYRCCGNGVVANVAEWLGLRLLAAISEAA